MTYSMKEKTLFQKWAEKNESRGNYDGLGMLIHQANILLKYGIIFYQI